MCCSQEKVNWPISFNPKSQNNWQAVHHLGDVYGIDINDIILGLKDSAGLFIQLAAGIRVLYTGDYSREEDRHLPQAGSRTKISKQIQQLINWNQWYFDLYRLILKLWFQFWPPVFVGCLNELSDRWTSDLEAEIPNVRIHVLIVEFGRWEESEHNSDTVCSGYRVDMSLIYQWILIKLYVSNLHMIWH